MKLFSALFVFVLLLFSTFNCLLAADEQFLRQQYEDFRRNGDVAGNHQPITDREGLAEVTLIFGREALETGEVEAAIEYFKTGLEQFPGDGRFSLMLGLGYMRIGENTLAELHLRDAIQRLPDSSEAHRLLYNLYYQNGQLADAEKVLREMLELTPDDPQLVEQLRQIRIELKVEDGMDQDIDSIFTVSFDGEVHADLAELAIESLQGAYTEQGSLLNYYPRERVQVILYTREDYDLTTGSPPWSAGRFDGKIRIPINQHSQGSIFFRTVLHHEYNHFLAQQLSAGRAPAWLYEGLAMVAESSEHQREINQLYRAATAGQLLPFANMEKSFSRLSQEEALLAYEQSFSFVGYIIQQFGWHTLRDLLVAFSANSNTDKSFASVFNDFGLSFADLQREWRTGL